MTDSRMKFAFNKIESRRSPILDCRVTGRESSMHPLKRMTRILILLLILRVLAAPIAARPDSYRPHPKAGFIVRVCAWPAQRPQHSNGSAMRVPDDGGHGHGGNNAAFPGTSARALAFLTRARLFHRVVLSFHDPGSYRPIDSPRC